MAVCFLLRCSARSLQGAAQPSLGENQGISLSPTVAILFFYLTCRFGISGFLSVALVGFLILLPVLSCNCMFLRGGPGPRERSRGLKGGRKKRERERREGSVGLDEVEETQREESWTSLHGIREKTDPAISVWTGFYGR
jgi:hypothetical protein